VGTLLAFTTVAVSVLIPRYVPPDEVPLTSGLQESIGSVSSQFDNDLKGTASTDIGYSVVSSKEDNQLLIETSESSIEEDIMQKPVIKGIERLTNLLLCHLHYCEESFDIIVCEFNSLRTCLLNCNSKNSPLPPAHLCPLFKLAMVTFFFASS